MSVLRHSLFGTEDIEAKAIERLKGFEKQALSMNPDGYWVAFSGGKDSIVILDLVRRAGVAHTVHYNVTTVDPPELISFMMKHYSDIEWNRPELTMWQLIEKTGFPPTRVARYCCRVLKEGGGQGSMVVTGVRWAESARRSKRRMVEACYSDKTRIYMHPIIDWSDDEVWQYIRGHDLPYCSLYDEGFKRLGCVGCPMSNRKAAFARWPQFERAYRIVFGKIVTALKESGREDRWDSADDVFDWWMGDGGDKHREGQMVMFDDDGISV